MSCLAMLEQSDIVQGTDMLEAQCPALHCVCACSRIEQNTFEG